MRIFRAVPPWGATNRTFEKNPPKGGTNTRLRLDVLFSHFSLPPRGALDAHLRFRVQFGHDLLFRQTGFGYHCPLLSAPPVAGIPRSGVAQTIDYRLADVIGSTHGH